MSIQSIVTAYAPDLRYMIGVSEPDHIIECVIDRTVETAVENATCKLFTQDDIETAEYDARQGVAKDLAFIVNDADWETVEDLTKLLNTLLDNLP